MDILQNCERAAARKTESRVIPGSIKFHPAHTAGNDAELIELELNQVYAAANLLGVRVWL